MEVAAQKRAEDEEWCVAAYVPPTWNNRAKSSQVHFPQYYGDNVDDDVI